MPLRELKYFTYICIMYYYDRKSIRNEIIQACGEGDLDKLKKINEQGHIEQWIINEALFYCVRACNIECAEYLVNTGRTSLHKMEDINDITWHIIQKSGINQSKRIKMFRYLYDGGLTSVAEQIVNKYLYLHKKKYLIMALDEFSNEIDFNKLFKDYIASGNLERTNDFINDIYQYLRGRKIDSLLCV